MLFFATPFFTFSQCEPGQSEVEIVIVPDNWPNEISWSLQDSDGNLLADGGASGTELCVEQDACLLFTIEDSFGDGIYSPGGYWVYIDGELLATGNDYGYGESTDINCPPGFSCNNPVTVLAGDYTTEWSDHWYIFQPEETGMYLISTCDGNDCDTKIWIYDYCDMNNFDDTNEATIYYDDENGGCGDNAQINALLEADHTYYIRIGDDSSCADGIINWSLTFNGPPVGCTDPAACNYTPLAESDNGSCIYPGDPDCTGPDLVVLQSAIETSMYASTIQVAESDCYINEGCLNGFGTREIIRFTTHIKNIGAIDYYIGPAGNQNPGQFEFDNCHNHWHYEGYARYDLFDLNNNFIPIGFKNGFCVIDLECSGGGQAQYGCGNMGITAGCGDIYGAGLNCQWIDVTDVPDGQYSLIVRVNWDNTPDALGRYEITYENNWAQVCIEIDRSGGTMEVSQIDDCPQYVDCMGQPFGNALADCNGDCNGTALMGDLDNNGNQEYADAYSYVEHILGEDIDPTTCNDLNQDQDINVTDAALLALCQFYNAAHQHPDSSGVHSKCEFPVPDITNPFDTVWWTIGDVNWNDSYIDIHIKNPLNKIVGYQFRTSGIEHTNVVSLYDPISYPINPAFVLGGDQVIGLSYEDSTIAKNYEWTPLCRIYFMNPEELVCLSEIVDVVNEDYHNTVNVIVDGCLSYVGLSEMAPVQGASLFPNPFRDQTTLRFANPRRKPHTVEILDLSGRIIRSYAEVKGTELKIFREELLPGAYFYRLVGENNHSGRFVVE